MKKPTLDDVQKMYPFKQPLSFYTMGISGKPEEREQKAFISCLMAEFPNELGHNEELDIYSGLIVATADFYTGGSFKGRQMSKYKKMGYQSGTPDITILCPKVKLMGMYHGFISEMKSLTGRASDTQKATIAHLIDKGYYAGIDKGFVAALKRWISYVNGAV